MGKFVGLLVFLIGLGLLTLSLCIPPILLPQSAWTVIWRAGLGFVLCVAGYVMASYSGADLLLKFMAVFVALLGITLLILGLFPALFGVPLYPGGGNTWRVIVGVLFCVGGYVLYELGGTVE